MSDIFLLYISDKSEKKEDFNLFTICIFCISFAPNNYPLPKKCNGNLSG